MVSCNDILIHTIFTHSDYHLDPTRYTATQKKKRKHSAQHQTLLLHHAWQLSKLLLHVSKWPLGAGALAKALNFLPFVSPQFSLHEREREAEKETNSGCGEKKKKRREKTENVEQFFADISQLNCESNCWAYLEDCNSHRGRKRVSKWQNVSLVSHTYHCATQNKYKIYQKYRKLANKRSSLHNERRRRRRKQKIK